MNERQKRFAEFYAANPNAAEAARAAGYSEHTARSQGQRMLTIVDIADYIRDLQDQAAETRIVSALQIKAFWSDVLRNPEEKTADRLKASELLAKAAGMFLNVGALDGEDGGEDVIIYLPANGRDVVNE